MSKIQLVAKTEGVGKYKGLTKEEFSGLSLSNCHYCNQEPPKS